MKLLNLTLLLSIFSFGLSSQCPEGQVEFELNITPDAWPQEISWELLTADGDTITHGLEVGETLCVDTGICYIFKIHDTFGDGIIGTGGYYLIYDGDTIVHRIGYDYDFGESFTMGCPVGASCDDPFIVSEGLYTAEYDDTWYIFTPDSTGTYEITTCSLATCNTKIWVYEECNSNIINDSNEGTLFYDDNEGGCGLQAVVNAYLEGGVSYYIRIGDSYNNCVSSVDWSLEYIGPVVGCMDPTACNYNPLATVSNGECYYSGDPECPGGPDLFLREDAIISSIYGVRQYITDQCMVMEGCTNGYGERDLIRFDTWIDNIGDEDFYVGTPQSNPDQFSFTNCHGHAHYEGYAEYIMWDENGTQIPIGFKSGFCVMDLTCDWGTAKYGCSNMGITAGCGDIYNAGLDCQWVDVTDIPDGRYTMVVRTNWDQSPDALGRYEQTYDNNVAQVCFWVDRSSGSPVVTVDVNCEPAVDCMGVPYGDAAPDCQGVCNGSAIMGDNDANGQISQDDIDMYIGGIVNQDMAVTLCNDLNSDEELTVYDAALLVNCNNNQSNMDDLCDFPRNTINPYDTTYYMIDTVDFENSFVDIAVYNPYNNISAFELDIHGIIASSVESLVDITDADMDFQVSVGSNKLIGICYDQSNLDKYADYTPICRVHFSNLSDLNVCIDQVITTVSESYEQTINVKSDDCFESPASVEGIEGLQSFEIQPNPASDRAFVQISTDENVDYTLVITDMLGRVVEEFSADGTSLQSLDISLYDSGVYFVRLVIGDQTMTKRLIVEK